MTSIMHIHLPIFLFTILFSCILAANNSYTPNDIFLLDCGTSSRQTRDFLDRNWTNDENFLLSTPSGSSSTEEVEEDGLEDVPYKSYRTFYSEATYSIPVSPGRIFIRFYFYTGYNLKYDIREVNFSITLNQNNKFLDSFNGNQMVIQSADLKHLVREYSVYVQHTPLKLTFTPSSNLDTTFAFVSGIEIVSMPNELYQFPNSPPNLTTLETMFRVNVGGIYIPPTRDTGLFRTWYDDLWYLDPRYMGMIRLKDKGLKIASRKGMVSTYLTPVDVYSSFREMSPYDNVNLRFNLTWRFSVDIGFTYMLRMHFCEIDMSIEENQVVFDIYINNQTVKSGVDIIKLTGGVGIPCILDFPVYQSDSEFIWVAMHPNVTTEPLFSNTRLNGLEIFKVINPEGTLNRNSSAQTQRRSFDRILTVEVIVGIVSVVALLIAVVLVLCHFHKYGAVGSSATATATATTTTTTTSYTPALVCRYFSLEEIKSATNDFDESLVLGSGGFGKVYRGEIDDGTMVAIKRRSSLHGQGILEFQTEIEMLSKLRHHHLVSLLGYCDENGEMILVYDYMACGTLREHLYKTPNSPLPLSWIQRLEICIGSARGLHYLHTGARQTIVHRDVKSTNILLDERMVAKVSDFGLSKNISLEDTHVSTRVKGTHGYLDPEYRRRRQLNDKSDVYSFGVVLLEVLCARPVLDTSLPTEQMSLDLWATECHTKGMLDQIMDPSLKGEISPECFKMFVDTAIKCVADTSVERPSMGHVLWNLETAYVLQVNKEAKVSSLGGTHTSEWSTDRFLTKSRSMVDIGRHNRFSSEVSDELTTRAEISKIHREAKGKGKLHIEETTW